MKVCARVLTQVLLFALLAGAGATDAAAQTPQAPPPPPAPAAGTPGSELDLDRNNDKVTDYKVIYDRTGNVGEEDMDFDLDGVMDTFFYYSRGLLAREEIDSNNDGKIDIWIYLIEGKYVQRYERDTDGDGKPDVVRTFGGP